MIKAWCLEEICWIFSLSLGIHETILYKFLPQRLASVWDPLVYFCQNIDRNWHSFVDILCNQKGIKLHSGLQQEKRQYDTAPLVAIQAALFRQQRTQKTLSPSSSLSVCSGWFYKMFHWLPSMSEYITFLSESHNFVENMDVNTKVCTCGPGFLFVWLLAAAWGVTPIFLHFVFVHS